MVPISVATALQMQQKIILSCCLIPKPEAIVIGLSKASKSKLVHIVGKRAVGLEGGEEVELCARSQLKKAIVVG